MHNSGLNHPISTDKDPTDHPIGQRETLVSPYVGHRIPT